MGKLDSRHSTLILYEAGKRSKGFGMGIAPDTAIAVTDASLGTYRSCLDHDQSRATHGTAAEMNKMPVSGKALAA